MDIETLTPDETRLFWFLVKKTDTCWLWMGAHSRGYGQFCINNKSYQAHRVSYILAGKSIPLMYVIDHLCRNPNCVNPEHLQAVEHRENVLRGDAAKPKNNSIDCIKRIKFARTIKLEDITGDDIERFFKSVDKTETCWNWIGSISRGYGKFCLNGNCEHAHRVSYIISGNIIPDSCEVDHICNNKKCIRPSHLQAISSQENNLRSGNQADLNAQKTRCPYGHELSGDNLYINSNSARECKICKNRRGREYNERKRLKYLEAGTIFDIGGH